MVGYKNLLLIIISIIIIVAIDFFALWFFTRKEKCDEKKIEK